jgi:hypothetical protein
MVRDPRSLNDTAFAAPIEWLEDVFGLDDYDPTYLHTFGIRLFGDTAGFDYDLHAAYQMGNADAVGAGFVSNLYGDNDADYDTWAGDIEVGYSFDVPWSPRVYVGGAYYGGEDNRDLSFWDWLNPFYRPEASVSFNRLFSAYWYTASFDILGGASAFSNFSQIRAGVTANPTESISTGLSVAQFWVNETFESPVSINLGEFIIPVAPNLSFWTEESDDDIGVVTHVWVKYAYTEDLWIKIGWEHMFTGDAMKDGNFQLLNGLDFTGGIDNEDADYLYFDTQLKF